MSLVSQNVYLWIWSRAQTAFSGFSSFSSSLIELQTPSKAVLRQVPEHPSLACRYSTLGRATLYIIPFQTIVLTHWWITSGDTLLYQEQYCFVKRGFQCTIQNHSKCCGITCHSTLLTILLKVNWPCTICTMLTLEDNFNIVSYYKTTMCLFQSISQ